MFISRLTVRTPTPVICTPLLLTALRKRFEVFEAMSHLSYVSTDLAGPAVGIYSQAVKYGDTVYLSGTLGLDASTGKLVEGGAGPEIKKALENIKHVLEASQSSFSSIVKTTVLLADIKDGPTVNEIYKQFFVPPYPARAMFQVAKLPLDAKVEIEVIAAVNK
ncbi:2-iminobutanoate/2-iminopropanoate deaminase-like [Rhopalosiphum maidis]|nr:2-iminobutanoate/2-iminopropanoate deaminase-like [Rhopalosiphum maidis]